MMESTSTKKYLKLWLIILVPVVIWLIWRALVSFIVGWPSTTDTPNDQNTWTQITTNKQSISNTTPSLGSTASNGQSTPTTLQIAVPDWFDTATMSDTVRTLATEQISVQRIIVTGADYHNQVRVLMKSENIDLALIATDHANDCGQWCALKFDYSQPIDAFVINSIIESIYDPYRTMIPYGLDPLVTYHSPKRKVGGSRGSLFNDILINTTTSDTAWSLPLAMGIGAADKALLRAGKEPYPDYAELIHQMIIQFSHNESLLKQLIQITDSTQLRSYQRMTKSINTIAEKFPICRETVAACLVRFTISHYGFGYLTDLMRLPPSRSSTITYDQFPIETNYYPLRLWWFIINRNSDANAQAMGRFLSVYVTSMLNTQSPESSLWREGVSVTTGTDGFGGLWLISPRVSRFEAQWYDPQYANIMRYTDSFRIIRGGKFTAIDRARKGGLVSAIDGTSSIQVYLSQQGINQ
jgi:hypothetical protein